MIDRIERIEILQVDLTPKVVRSDAIQSPPQMDHVVASHLAMTT